MIASVVTCNGCCCCLEARFSQTDPAITCTTKRSLSVNFHLVKPMELRPLSMRPRYPDLRYVSVWCAGAEGYILLDDFQLVWYQFLLSFHIFWTLYHKHIWSLLQTIPLMSSHSHVARLSLAAPGCRNTRNSPSPLPFPFRSLLSMFVPSLSEIA